MSEEEKPAKSFEEKDENVEREDGVHTQQSSLSEKKGEIQQVRYRKGEKIKRKKRDLKSKTEKKNKIYSGFAGNGLHNAPHTNGDSNDNGRLNSIRGMDTAVERNQPVAVNEETTLGDNITNEMMRYNELCTLNTCFSSTEVEADNLDNSSVLNENIAVICQERVEFNGDEENGLN